MAIQSDLYSLLSGDGTLLALVTVEGNVNIYPQKRPQAAGSPCVVYQQVATEGMHTLGGVSLDDQGNYQIVVLAADYGTLVQVTAAIKALNGSSQGDIKKFMVEEGPTGFDFELEQFTQALNVILSI